MLIWLLVQPEELRKMEGKLIFHPHTTNWPTAPGESSHYTIASSIAAASWDNKQDCKTPQSPGSGLGMKRPKTICRLNGNSVVIPFPPFSLLLAFPWVQCHTFSPPQLNHLGGREEKISKDSKYLRGRLLVCYNCKLEGSFENYFT